MDPDPRVWHRLHPLSPVLRLGRTLVVVLFVLGETYYTSGGDRTGHEIEIGIAAAGLAASVVAWLVTRWRVEDGDLRIETGLLSRRSRRVPLVRLQAVDVVRPLLGRALGLAELRLQVAGDQRSATRLAYLGEAEAERLRLQLLDLAAQERSEARREPAAGGPAAGGPAQSPPEAGPPLVSVPLGRLVGATVLQTPTLLLVVLVVAFLVLSREAPRAAGALGGAVFAYLVGLASVTWRRLSSSYGFDVRRVPGGVQVRSGLLSTRTETIPVGRVQGVRVVEPLLWRPLGWCRVVLDVAGRHGDRREDGGDSRTVDSLLPVGPRADAAALLDLVLPGARPQPRRPPARARWRSPLRFHNLAGGWTGDYLVTGTGRLARITDVVPLAKVQSLRMVQGPLDRRMRLASLHADVAGRAVHAALRDRDADLLRSDLDVLAGLCRRARQDAGGGVTGSAAGASTR